MITRIYGLYDENDNIRYVGKTKGSIAKRLGDHIFESICGASTYKGIWIRSMLSKGVSPTVKKLLTVNGDIILGNFYETFYILLFRGLGAKLTNATDGGDGFSGYIKTAEHIRKVGLANLGKKRTKECKLKMSKAKLGKRLNPEVYKRQAETRRINNINNNFESYKKGVITRRERETGSGYIQMMETRKKRGLAVWILSPESRKRALETRKRNRLIKKGLL